LLDSLLQEKKMSHISEFMEEVPVSPGLRRGNITSAWDCCTTASKTAKVYRSQMKSVNRLVSYTADIIAANEEIEYPESKAFIANTTWSVHRVSPLWNVKFKNRKDKKSLDDSEFSIAERLEYDEAALKRYSAIIRGFLVKDVSDFSDNPISVVMSPLQGLRGSRNDKDALKIEAFAVFGEDSRTIFSGVLCGVDTSELEVTSSNATSLPVFLTNGNQDTTDRVIYGLAKCFDCVIAPLLLSDADMKFASALWTGLEIDNSNESTVDCTIQQSRSTKRRKVLAEKNSLSKTRNSTTNNSKDLNVSKSKKNVGREEVTLVYSVPRDLEAIRQKISSFTLSLSAAEVKELRRCVHKPGETEFTDEEMETFHAALNTIVKQALGLRVDRLDLEEVRLPLITVSARGRVRISHENNVKVVLRHLTPLCQGDMLTANPSLGVYSSV